MTAVESLPRYAEAEKVAAARGLNLWDMLSGYIAGIADMGGADLPDYMSDDVLPGETVLRTPEEIDAHFDRLLKEAGA